MKRSQLTQTVLLVGLALAPGLSLSATEGLEVKAVAEVEVKTKAPNGQEKVRRAPAEKVVPGTAVIYTLHAKNTSAKPAGEVVIVDPVPEHMDYLDGSARGDGTHITFSVDGGKSYDLAGKLKVKGPDGALRSATAADFTHIRWQFERPLDPGEARAVEFRALLE